jgi:hypothetical protein
MESSVDGKKHPVTIVNFGIQDAHRAREFGRDLARYEFDYEQAEAEIWREAWDRYPHRSSFFARCFAREAKNAYADAAERG